MRQLYNTQQSIENQYSLKGLVSDVIRDFQQTDWAVEKIQKGLDALKDWMSQDYWESKNQRIQAMGHLDLELLVYQLCSLIALQASKPMKLVSIAAMSAKFLGMAHKKDSIHLGAELIAVLASTELYRISQSSEGGYEVQSLVGLEDEITQRITDSCYVPPMVIRPRKLRRNRDSGYITLGGESLILGFYENHHEGDICLDVLNKLNRTALSLDQDFLDSVKEAYQEQNCSPEEHDEQALPVLDLQNWQQFKRESEEICQMLIEQGNRFYMTHKVDKRGRVYSQGYHINPQGNSYRKAMVNLAKEETCTGIDTW